MLAKAGAEVCVTLLAFVSACDLCPVSLGSGPGLARVRRLGLWCPASAAWIVRREP